MVSSVKKMAYDFPTGKEQKLRPSWNWFHFSLASNLMMCALAWRTLGSWRCWWNFLEFRGVIKIAKTGINHCKYIVILIDLRMKKLLLWLVMQSDIMTFVSQSFKKVDWTCLKCSFWLWFTGSFFWGGRKESKVYRSQHSLTKNVYFVSIKTGQVPSIPNWTIGESSNLPHATDFFSYSRKSAIRDQSEFLWTGTSGGDEIMDISSKYKANDPYEMECLPKRVALEWNHGLYYPPSWKIRDRLRLGVMSLPKWEPPTWLG